MHHREFFDFLVIKKQHKASGSPSWLTLWSLSGELVLSRECAFPDSNFAAEVLMERRDLHDRQLRRGFLADFMVDPRHCSGVRRNTEVAQSRVILLLLAFFVIFGLLIFLLRPRTRERDSFRSDFEK